MKKILLILCLCLFSTPALAAPKVAHILVALCDNIYQGIVPVPPKIGNGDDPDNNLYWGAMYGLRTYLKKSPNWQLVEDIKNPQKNILQRSIFKHKTKDVWIVADAYRGRNIKDATTDFFDFTAGLEGDTIKVKETTLNIKGSADFIGYVGHDGLMDFSLDSYPQKSKDSKNVMVLACYSRHFFGPILKNLNPKTTLLTTNKLAPEGYVAEAALNIWAQGENSAKMRTAAASAYAKYQKISKKSALGLFVAE